jgi:SAM-dependent methyltransferase
MMIDLGAFVVQDGIHIISPPQRFDGGEEEYDAFIGGAHKQDLLRCGRGAWQLIARYATRPVVDVVELGAGGGTCSLGLIASAKDAEVLITDTSPDFLRLVQRKCAAAGLGAERVRYATLAGEALEQLGTASADAIVIASALHHVDDWPRFLLMAAGSLRPGGVLVVQEPFRAGNLMMAMAMDVALSPLWPAEAALSADDAARLDACRNSIYFLANSHIHKVGEDKHSFLLSDLTHQAGEAGFARTAFYSNRHFEDLADTDLANHEGACSLVGYLESFLRNHHRISAPGMASLKTHLFPILRQLDETFRRGDGPPLLGSMVFCT